MSNQDINKEPYLILHRDKTISYWLDYFLVNIPSPKNTNDLIITVSHISKLFNEVTRYYNETNYNILEHNSDIESKKSDFYRKNTADRKPIEIKPTVLKKNAELLISDDIELLNKLLYEKEFWEDIRNTLKIQIDLLKQAAIITSHDRKLTGSM